MTVTRSPQTSETLIVDQVSPGVLRATLSSPSDRNALSAGMRNALAECLSGARTAGVKVLIVKGSDGVFCSGYRLDPEVMRPASVVEDRARLVEVTRFLRTYRDAGLITIAQVDGHCVAGGTDLMLASDITIAAHDASIVVPNVRGVGISLLLPVWPWLVGPQRAKLLTVTGDPFSGREAAAWGLVASSVPSAQLSTTVEELATRVALMPRDMLEVTKAALNTAWESAGMDSLLSRAAELDALAHATEPAAEFWRAVQTHGIRRAVNRRDAPFHGSRLLDFLAE